MAQSGLSTATIMKGLCGLKDEELLFDVKLKTEEKTLSAHRALLAAVSPYFKDLFKEGGKDVVELKDIKFDALRRVINCIYTPGSLVLSAENISGILAAAHSFQIQDIMEQCQDFMENNLCTDNCFLFLKLAETYNLKELVSQANEYVLTKFHALSEDHDLTEMSKDALVAYLENDTLNSGGDESRVFYAVVEWLKKDDGRMADIHDVMSHIRFKTMKIDSLVEIAKNKVIEEDDECKALVINALAYHGKREEKPLVDEIQNKPRGKPGLFIMQSGSLANWTDWTDAIDKSPFMLSLNDRNLHRSKIETKFVDFSLSLIPANNFLFLFAIDSETMLPTTMRYDVNSGEWLKLTPVPRTGGAAIGSSVAKLGDDIFLINGSLKSEDYTGEAFKYNIASNTWTKVKNPPYKGFLNVAAACEANASIYLSGGAMNQKYEPYPISKVAAYDVQSNVWLEKPDMNHARAYHLMEAMTDKIYVLGGHKGFENRVLTAVKEIEVHDIASEQWTVIEGETLNRWGSGAAIIDNNIYIIGGWSLTDEKDPQDPREKLRIHLFDTKEERVVSDKDLFLPEELSYPVGAYFTLPQLL